MNVGGRCNDAQNITISIVPYSEGLEPRVTLPPMQNRSMESYPFHHLCDKPYLPAIRTLIPSEMAGAQRPDGFLGSIPRGGFHCASTPPAVNLDFQGLTQYLQAMNLEPSFAESKVEDHCKDWNFKTLLAQCYCSPADRPNYTTNGKTRVERVPNSKQTSLVQAEITDAAGWGESDRNEKHAKAERSRRQTHKSSLVTLYRSANSLALEMAGWPERSPRAPTKEQIMTGSIHQHAFQNLVLKRALREIDRLHARLAVLDPDLQSTQPTFTGPAWDVSSSSFSTPPSSCDSVESGQTKRRRV